MTATTAKDPAPQQEERRALFAVLLLAVAAVVLRAIALNGGLWIDEMYAVTVSVRLPLWEILTEFDGDGQHPLYAVLAHLSSSLVGESPWAARLPALVFGVASVPMLYLLGRQVADRREALMAAALLAVSYHHVWFSQNARGYTMLAFFALLATWALVRAVRDGGWRWYVLFAVATGLGAYTHLTMVFMAVGQFLVLSVWMLRPGSKAPGWLPVIGGFGLAALVTLLLYAPILDQVLWWFLYRPSNFVGLSTPGWALEEAMRVLRQGVGAGPTLLVAGGILALGTVSWMRRDPFVLALFVVPGVVTLMGALLARGTMYPRFFFYLVGFAVLLLVRGLVVIADMLAGVIARDDPGARGRYTNVIAGVFLLLGIVVSLSSLRYNYRYPKQDFGGAMAWVDASRAEDEPIVLADGATAYAYQFHGRELPFVKSIAELEEATRGATGYWLVYTFPRYIELESPDLMARIQDECRERRVFDGTVGDGDVVVCRMRAGTAQS